MKCPLEHNGITQKFKKSGKDKHLGIDLGWNSKYGGIHAPVYSTDKGVITSVAKQKTGGWTIWIYHEHLGVASEYGHLQDKSIKVKKGDKVKMGQHIANMGNTGGIYNKKTKKYDPVPYHLHYGVQKGKGNEYGITAIWYNPLDFINVYDDQNTSTKSKDLIYHTKKVVNCKELNIRTKPSTKGKVVDTAKKGEQVETYGVKKGWNIVNKYKGYYCSNKYLK